MTVIHSFTPSIISSPTLSEIQAKNIVAFMMDCQHKVFKVPEGVKVTALGRIHRIKNGQSDLCRGKNRTKKDSIVSEVNNSQPWLLSYFRQLHIAFSCVTCSMTMITTTSVPIFVQSNLLFLFDFKVVVESSDF